MSAWFLILAFLFLLSGGARSKIQPVDISAEEQEHICRGMPDKHCALSHFKFQAYRLANGTRARVLDGSIGSVPPPPLLRTKDGHILSAQDWSMGAKPTRSLTSKTTRSRFAPVNVSFPLLRPDNMDLSASCHLSTERPNACEPAFLMAGCTKCASSSLWHYLGAHPSIAQSQKLKEIEWSDRWTYLPRLNKNSGQISGWANPLFMYEKLQDLPMKIFKANPTIKLIFVLRDPLDRAVSNYIYAGHFGTLQQAENVLHWPPEMHFSSEWAFLHECWSEGRSLLECGNYHYFADGWPFSVFQKRRRQFVAAGLYYQILREWYKVFPAENILLVKYEYLKQQPVEALNGVFSFLGVAPIAEFMDLKVKNARPVIANYTYESPSQTFLKGMRKLYTPHNRMLYDFLLPSGTEWDDWDRQ